MNPKPAAAVVPAPLLVLGGIVSVQFGGALAAQLVPEIGAGGAVLLRVGFAVVVLVPLSWPKWRAHGRADWFTAIGFGLALGSMNWSFYGALAHLPLGVAVTVEFLGPLVLTTVLSRRFADFAAVAAAGLGVVLISRALTEPWDRVSWVGILLALVAGACWAAYILMSGRTGAAFPGLEGLSVALLVATVLILPAGLASLPRWTGHDVVKGLGLAVLSSLLPYSLELIALRRMHPRVFGILLSIEPAVAALAGLLVLGQQLEPLQLLGLVLVVSASVVVMSAGWAPASVEEMTPGT